MEQTIKLLMQLIKAEVTGEKLNSEIVEQLTPDVLGQLYQISSKHDLAHVIGAILEKYHLTCREDMSVLLSEYFYLSLIRYENIQQEIDKISALFESEEIVYVPLKGAVIRKFYAEPWLRTSCDIDILIHPEDVDRARELLASRLQYREESYNYKDVSMYAPSDVHLELHFMIREHNETLDRVLGNVWKYVRPISEDAYQYEMTPEFFLFHLFAHMAYHISVGGCGVRFFVDIWLLMHQMQYDEALLKELCDTCGIWTFANAVRKLADVWFEEDEHDELSRNLQEYVLSGGIYGKSESAIAAHRTRTSGGFGYIWQRIFMPYVDLCVLYPRLKKAKILYPFYTIARWCTVFRSDVFKRVTSEAKMNYEISAEQVAEYQSLFQKLGL